jgi:hypothetical protein
MDAYGQPFTSPALVTNMSIGGLVLQGIQRRLREGEILDLRMGDETAQFRVVWIGGPGSTVMGMERITAQAFLPDSVLTHCSQAAAC